MTRVTMVITVLASFLLIFFSLWGCEAKPLLNRAEEDEAGDTIILDDDILTNRGGESGDILGGVNANSVVGDGGGEDIGEFGLATGWPDTKVPVSGMGNRYYDISPNRNPTSAAENILWNDVLKHNIPNFDLSSNNLKHRVQYPNLNYAEAPTYRKRADLTPATRMKLLLNYRQKSGYPRKRQILYRQCFFNPISCF